MNKAGSHSTTPQPPSLAADPRPMAVEEVGCHQGHRDEEYKRPENQHCRPSIDAERSVKPVQNGIKEVGVYGSFVVGEVDGRHRLDSLYGRWGGTGLLIFDRVLPFPNCERGYGGGNQQQTHNGER